VALDMEGVEIPQPLSGRRWFTPSEITAAWLRQDRGCAVCKRKLDRDLFEGDHIVAWTEGGTTTLDNLQALCGPCNKRKGNRAAPEPALAAITTAPSTAPLRAWQEAALEVALASTKKSILIEACPGAGKTRFALELAARLFGSGEINRVILVVPTKYLVAQWVAAAQGPEGGPTLPLAPPGWRPTAALYESWCGAVVTYHALFAQPTMFEALANERSMRTLVIFDEIHHAGAESAWGINAQQAFMDAAQKIVSISGTPFRVDDPIVFVETLAGRAIPDFSYGYGQAVEDQVCRPVRFAELGGTATFRAPDRREHTVTFDDDLNEQGESYRLRTALMADGGHMSSMLDLGTDLIVQMRAAGDADAAGLVVAMDCDHADQVARILHAKVGRRPVVACSRLNDPEDPAPDAAIASFSASRDPWIVAVKMVSEGVDIRRLRVVVYATNVLTELTFRQIMGRVVRGDPANGLSDFGIAIIPADPRLHEFASSIAQENRQLLSDPLVIVGAGSAGRHVSIEGDVLRSRFEPLSSTGELSVVSDGLGRTVSIDLWEAATAYVRRTGSPIDPFEIAMAASADPRLEDRLREISSREHGAASSPEQ